MFFKDLFSKPDSNSSKRQEEKITFSNKADQQGGLEKVVLTTSKDLSRLYNGALSLAKMFESLHEDPDMRLLIVAGTTGYVCHETVKAKGEKFDVRETKDGRHFYFGDAINRYFFENSNSVFTYLGGYYQHKFHGKDVPDINAAIMQGVTDIGNENYLIWGKYRPDDVFKFALTGWLGLYRQKAEDICKSADEWPELFGIVLQEILLHMDGDPDELYRKALECAMYLSRMDIDSQKKPI